MQGCEKQQILAISRLSNARLDSNWMNSGQNFSSEQDSSTLELPTVEQDEDPTLLQLDDLIQVSHLVKINMTYLCICDPPFSYLLESWH